MRMDQSTKQDCVTLAEETVSFGGMHLKYTLTVDDRFSERFRVAVSSGEERSESGAGNELGFALNTYRAVLHGRVTPCCLEDVMCDLCRRVDFF